MWNVGSVYKLLQKQYGLGLLGRSTIVPAAADNSAHTADNIDLVYELVWLGEK